MDINKLQNIIINSLEEIKGQDIKIFNVKFFSKIFDRVIIVSGISSIQTKALALNVSKNIKKMGGIILGMEGENTGEWVLVDCNDIIVHIMQPNLRQYYKLEDLYNN